MFIENYIINIVHDIITTYFNIFYIKENTKYKKTQFLPFYTILSNYIFMLR